MLFKTHASPQPSIQRYKRYDLAEPDNDHIASAFRQLSTTARPDLMWPDDLQLAVA
jgi:hypothetical protein